MVTDASLTTPFEEYVEEAASRSKGVLDAIMRGGAFYADLFLEQTEGLTLHASMPAAGVRLRSFQSEERKSSGVAVRGFDGDNHKLLALNGWQPDTWMRAANDIASQLSRQTSAAIASHVAPQEISWLERIPSDAPHAVSLAEKENVLATLTEMAFSYDQSISSCSIDYKENTRSVLLINSVGQAVVKEQVHHGVRLEVSTERGAVSYGTRGYTGGFGSFAFDNLDRFVKSVVDRVKQYGVMKPVPAGIMPVVFAGGWTGLWLHETIGHLLEADVAAQFVAIGDEVGSSELTVVDDATRTGSQGSFSVDDEGVPAQRTTIIDRGTVTGFLTDRYQAHRQKMGLSGNGRRQHYTDIPLPRMSNLCLLPGTANAEDLVASVNHGLYVKQAGSGLHRNAEGRFEIHVSEGFCIESGKISYPVRNVTVSGHSLPALQKIRGIGREAMMDTGLGVCKKAGQVMPVSVQSPSVLIDGLEVKQG